MRVVRLIISLSPPGRWWCGTSSVCEYTPVPPAQYLHNHKAFMSFVISWPGQSRWKTITQAVNSCCVCSNTLPCFSKQPSIHRFSTESKVSICGMSADRSLRGTSTHFYSLPFSRAALCRAARLRVYPELITSELDIECLPSQSQACQGEASTLPFCCFSSSHSGWGWKNSADVRRQIKTACCHD